ncbi:hypothetical protein CK203_048553 [Vitis vinifera]|uniref:Uncharacterized protein n=1 Tax=Vitis vinifera TaxID=29760 RepID=A0A438FXA8_VITVI|nr:hypothetical protein CK203_048553 [Vitis vinifera]
MTEQQPSNGGKLDAANPYFLHHSDHPGMVLVSKPSMGIIIRHGQTRRTCFVEKMQRYDPLLDSQFTFTGPLQTIERDIACLTQDQMTVAAYYTRLKKLWDELGSYNDTVLLLWGRP